MANKKNGIYLLHLVRRITRRIVFHISPRFFNFLVKVYNKGFSLYAQHLISRKKLFENIYDKNNWGNRDQEDTSYYSGPGSHEVSVVNDYYNGIDYALSNLCEIHKPNVVDLGCGDFSIGSRIRPFFGQYIACDLVNPLIKRNRKHYNNMDVDFRIIDAVSDTLPPADVVIIRQVFQHLSNRDIMKILKKVWANYRYLLLTEHLPATNHFQANIDIITGEGIRLAHGSGVVITKPPFLYQPVYECQVAVSPQYGGIIQTTWYQIK